jgi:hypothetical protein
MLLLPKLETHWNLLPFTQGIRKLSAALFMAKTGLLNYTEGVANNAELILQ